MKRLISIILTLAMLPLLCGCGSLYTNYREMEQLLVLQTMGLDTERQGLTLSLASAAEAGSGGSPTRLQIKGSTIASALEQARNYSFEESLFFAHIASLLIGEEAARGGIDECINYICQSPRLRMDMPLYIVRGGTAGEAVLATGDGTAGIAEIMAGVRDDFESRSPDTLFSVIDIERATLRYGAALVCALEIADSIQDSSKSSISVDGGQGGEATAAGGGDEAAGGAGSGGESTDANAGGQSGSSAQGGDAGDGGDSQGGESGGAQDGADSGTQSETQSGGSASGGAENQGGMGTGAKTVASAGYAVLKDGKLCAYLDRDEALGVSFLLNSVGRSDVVVRDTQEKYATLEINSGGSKIKPVWDSAGQLRRIDVAAEVGALVLEMDGRGSMDKAEYADKLTAELESLVSERISYVLRMSRQLNADFLGLAGEAERSAPEKYAAMGVSFEELFPTLELRVTVKGQIWHSNDLRETV